MQVPRIDKIVLNMGVGEGVNDRKKVDIAAPTSRMIAGQKAVITHARKSIATYKLRENQPIGCKVTLRRKRMYEFLDRLVNIALPRVRDFRGLNPKSFDGRGNYTIGIKDTSDFPRDRLRQGGVDAGHGHRRLHDGEERRRGAGVARRFQFPVPAVRGVRPSSNADTQETLNGEDQFNREEQAARAACQAVCGPALAAEGDRAATRPSRWKSASRRR